MAFLEILKDDILQLNFHTFIGSWAQFEELHGPFVNLGVHLPPKHNSPKKIMGGRVEKWREVEDAPAMSGVWGKK